jgi:hypothetical protein
MRMSWSVLTCALGLGLVAAGGCDPGSELVYVYSPSGLTLREAPGTESPVLDVLPYGAPVTVVQSVEAGDPASNEPGIPDTVDSLSGQWFEVRSGMQSGYVFGGYLTRFEPPPDPDVFPEGPLVKTRFVYGANVLSLRTRPSQVSRPIAFVAYGDSLEVLLAGWGEQQDSLDGMPGHWLRVRWRGVEGFVFGEYLSEFRPLADRFARGDRSFTRAYVHGTQALVLRSAPSSSAEPRGELAYGDSVNVIVPAEPLQDSVEGLWGSWVYGRRPSMEGYAFDAFLTAAPPPAPDTATDGAPPLPVTRFVMTHPGARVWTVGEARFFTRDFIHYGDSVRALFGGRSYARSDDDARRWVRVRLADREEGLVTDVSLSPLPVPLPGTAFRDYVEETLGRRESEASSAVDLASGIVEGSIEFNRGVTGERLRSEAGDMVTRYRLPGLDLQRAFALLALAEENAFFTTAGFPGTTTNVPGFDASVSFAPGGELAGVYVVDVGASTSIALEVTEEGVTVTFGPAPPSTEDPDPGGDTSTQRGPGEGSRAGAASEQGTTT